MIWLTLWESTLTSEEKCIAKNRPPRIWTIKQTPSKDPKFHMIVIFLGVGKNKIKFWKRVNKGFIFFTLLKNKKQNPGK